MDLVFFNASVILAGIKSPTGGSGKILSLVKQKKIKGIISEIILDEVLRNASKVGIERATLEKSIKKVFQIEAAPKEKTVRFYGDFDTW